MRLAPSSPPGRSLNSAQYGIPGPRSPRVPHAVSVVSPEPSERGRRDADCRTRDASGHRTNSIRVGALCLATLFAPAPAFAQSTLDSAAQLSPFWVLVDAAPSDDLALRPFTLVRDARSARSTATLKDSLADAPGVLLQESFGGFEPPRLSIRGSGLQSAPSSRGVAFLLDGFPLGLADGSFNSTLVEPQFADRIEFFRGDASAAVAPAVLGGAFDLRTDGNAPATLRAVAGAFGAAQSSLSGQTRAHNLTLDGAASFTTQDGFRPHSDQRRTALIARAQISTTSVSVYHARAAYDVPGPLTLAAATLDPASVSTDVRRDQPRRESALTQITAQTSRQNSVATLDTGVSWLRTVDWFRQLQANGTSDSHSDDVTLRAALARRFDSTTGDNALRLGTTFSRGWRDLARFRNDSSATGPRFGDDGLFATTASADLEGTAQLPEHLSLTAGVGALFVRRDISDRLASTASTSRRLLSSALDPRARLTWSAAPGLAFHASIAQATEPPTFDDLLFVAGSYPNLTRRSQPLLNQNAATTEFGASGHHGPLSWDLTAYTADWRHEILRLADASGQPRGAVNAGPTRHRGVEATARWRLLDCDQRLTLVATAAWNQFTFVNDPLYADNRLAGAPPHQGSASLLYENPSGFFAAPALEWVAGATPVDHAGKLTCGGSTLAHLRVGWRKSKTWTVFAEIKNLFDREHIASTAGVLDLARNPAATAVFLPGSGRVFSVGFEWSPR